MSTREQRLGECHLSRSSLRAESASKCSEELCWMSCCDVKPVDRMCLYRHPLLGLPALWVHHISCSLGALLNVGSRWEDNISFSWCHLGRPVPGALLGTDLALVDIACPGTPCCILFCSSSSSSLELAASDSDSRPPSLELCLGVKWTMGALGGGWLLGLLTWYVKRADSHSCCNACSDIAQPVFDSHLSEASAVC